MTNGIDSIYESFGVSAVYTDLTETELTVTVIVDRNFSQYGETAQVSAGSAVLCVRKSEVALSPRRAESFTVGAKVWTVDSLVLIDDYEHRAICS